MVDIKLFEKLGGKFGSISGITSIFGSWQVCHNICLGIITLLSLIGISVSGMPLAFLTEIAMPLWWTAFGLLIITILIYMKKPCISRNLIIFNIGVIIFGLPFFQNYSLYFRIIGGVIALTAITLFIKNKWMDKK